MVRRIHEGSDSLEERLAATTEQDNKGTIEEQVTTQVPEMIAENVEVDGVTNDVPTTLNTDVASNTVKPNITSSSEEMEEETAEGEENVSKMGKDGMSYNTLTFFIFYKKSL